jgi:nicotinamidase-related amidase
MSTHENPPDLFSAGDAYRAPYPARMADFMAAGLTAGLAPARDDNTTIALVLVDMQHDFVAPDGALAVPGAQDDLARLLAWLYRNAGRVTRIYLSLDTHLPSHIFYSGWWIDPRTGQHPAPFTAITVEQVERGEWAPLVEAEWSLGYVRALRQQARKDLMIWPPHTMEGTLGHMLAAPLSEAVAWHSAARDIAPIFLSKGRTPRTEFYGVFGAEVADPSDSRSALNTALLDEVMRHDRVYVAGEAKSHCVLETARQIVARYEGQPDILGRLHILTDCVSAVAHPTIDFDSLAEAEFVTMRERGAQFVASDDSVL